MSDAVPISQAHYELRRTELVDFILQRRDRSAAAIKKLTGKWDVIRRVALLGTLAVLFWREELAARVGSSTALTIGLVLVVMSFYASRQIRQRVQAAGAQAGPQPRWLIKRVFSKRLFKERDSLQGTVSFYEDRLVIQQGDARFESTYEDGQIAAILLSEHYLEIIPETSTEMPDDLFFVPLQDIENRDELLALLREQSGFMAV